jgi:hypothetical protein
MSIDAYFAVMVVSTVMLGLCLLLGLSIMLMDYQKKREEKKDKKDGVAQQ